VKYAWIESARDEFKVNTMCRVLEVSRSGYYDWLRRAPSLHAQKDEMLSQRIGA
ncbi:IS3 family transposase, partial [Candidatus Entotheonella serta]